MPILLYLISYVIAYILIYCINIVHSRKILIDISYRFTEQQIQIQIYNYLSILAKYAEIKNEWLSDLPRSG